MTPAALPPIAIFGDPDFEAMVDPCNRTGRKLAVEMGYGRFARTNAAGFRRVQGGVMPRLRCNQTVEAKR